MSLMINILQIEHQTKRFKHVYFTTPYPMNQLA